MRLSDDWPRSGRSCFEFRRGMEGEAAAAAALKRNDDDLQLLEVAIHSIENAAIASLGIEEDLDFHVAVAAASHNQYFVAVLKSLRETIVDGMLLARTSLGFNREQKLQAINRQHRAVLEMIRMKDADGARNAMRAHLSQCKLSTSAWYLLEHHEG